MPLARVCRSAFAFIAFAALVSGYHTEATTPAYAVTQVMLSSSWAGLSHKPFPHSEITLRRSGQEFVSASTKVPAKLVDSLLQIAAQPALPSPDAHNLGVDAAWLNTHLDEAARAPNMTGYDTPAHKQAFRAELTNMARLPKRLDEVYRSSHTDDYPSVEVRLVLSDGVTVTFKTGSQNPYMLPWEVIDHGRKTTTYNADISRAVFAMVDDNFTNRPRLSGMNLAYCLGETVGGPVDTGR